jgi:hypothetical protein
MLGMSLHPFSKKIHFSQPCTFVYGCATYVDVMRINLCSNVHKDFPIYLGVQFVYLFLLYKRYTILKWEILIFVYTK